MFLVVQFLALWMRDGIAQDARQLMISLIVTLQMFLPNLKYRSWNVLFLFNLPSQSYRFWWSESKTDSISFFHLFTIAFKRNPNSGIVELIYVLDEIYSDDIDQKYRTRFFPVSISFRD